MDLALKRVQADLVDSIQRMPKIPPSPLPIDRWIASSMMQKAIRRGDIQAAQAAGCMYLLNDNAGVWRRLIVVAYEDIAATATDALIETVVICTDSAYRRAVGAIPALLYLCERLAAAPKERSSDYLICSAKTHPSFELMREECSSLTVDERILLSSDKNRSLPERATAAWYASGLEWRPEQRVGKGDLLSLIEHSQSLGMDSRLASATFLAASRIREPIVAMAPVLHLAIKSSKSVALRASQYAARITPYGIPTYALDKHTRLGKQAMRDFISQSKLLRTQLERYLPDQRWADAIGLAAFYVDAVPITPHLHWDETASLERLGIETDFLTVGLSYEQGQSLILAVQKQQEVLDRIRGQAINRYVRSAQREREELALG